MRQPVQFGKYLLLDRIAVGGMAEVFAAKAFGVEGFERILAIKKILPTMGEDPELVSMFVDEARIAVQLSHPNIVQVLELGKHDETLYIAMEYISGRDLRQLLDRFRRRGQPMPIPQACAIAARVCDALDYAHRKGDASGKPLGIVHRDVSPQNVLVSFDGGVKLIDFGIAKAERRLQKTQSGILKGKFSYMSPEQVRGEALDRRSDVFAAGVLLWELICGRKLFTGDSDYAVLEKVRRVEVPPPASVNPEVPRELSRVVLAALAPEPRDRYQWCGDLQDDLQQFAQLAGAPLGSRQLAGFLREEIPAEHEKEQARLQRWMRASGTERTSPDAPRKWHRTSPEAPRSWHRTSPDAAREWHVAPDADTLVPSPAPAARTQPDGGPGRVWAAESPTVEVDSAILEEQHGTTQPTHVLGPGEGTVPQFDSSGEPTAARRAERRGALTRPRKARAGSRVRLLGAGAVVGLIALIGFAYFGLLRGPGKVIVTVTPAVAAELMVDGRSSGPLPPFARLLQPGRHRLEVRAAGYKPFTAIVELGRRPVEVEAALAREEPPESVPALTGTPVPETRTEMVASVPAEQRGTTRGTQRRRPHQAGRLLAANAPMVVPTESAGAASSAADETAAVAVVPQSEPAESAGTGGADPAARLHVISEPIGAEIRLAGRSIGRAPLTTDLLEPGRDYDLSASLEGYVSVRRLVRTGSGVTDVTLALPLQPIAGASPAVARAEAQAHPPAALIGYLVTNTRPAARVSIDGRETGRWTPVPEANPIALPAGAHTILFETADGKRLEETLQIEPGKTARLVRELEK
jgi:eukaryotic-like serine/threonine-protein kinase